MEQPRPNLSAQPDQTEHASAQCANCGALLAETFCAACGQKRYRSGDLSLKHAWHHVVQEALEFDGKIFHSVKLLLTKPGQLTLDFIEGRRARHVHPIRLFVVFLFLFFFFAPVNPFLDMGPRLKQELLRNETTAKGFRERAERKGLEVEKVFDNASARIRDLSKPLDLVVITVNGALLFVLFRKKRPYLAENMVMGLHLASFNMAAQLVIGWLRIVPGLMVAATVAIAGVSIGYFLLAGRRVYAASWISLVLKYAAMLAVQFLLISATLAWVFLTDVRAALS